MRSRWLHSLVQNYVHEECARVASEAAGVLKSASSWTAQIVQRGWIFIHVAVVPHLRWYSTY
jgi:hypothetical protein